MSESKKTEISLANQSEHVYLKTKRQIMTDNLLGGISWGVGSVIGATIIVGFLGLAIVRTRNVPLLGDIIQVVVNEIQTGITEFNNK